MRPAKPHVFPKRYSCAYYFFRNPFLILRVSVIFLFRNLGYSHKNHMFFCEHRTQVLTSIYLHHARFPSGISIPCFWWVDGWWVEEGAGLIGGSGPIGTYHVGVPAFRKGWMTVKLNVPAFRNAGTHQNLMFQPSERLEHCKTQCSSLPKRLERTKTQHSHSWSGCRIDAACSIEKVSRKYLKSILGVYFWTRVQKRYCV